MPVDAPDRKKKRNITESRRQQGREAQKRYREKQKLRNQGLAESSASGGPHEVSHNSLLPVVPTPVDDAIEESRYVEQEPLVQEPIFSGITDANLSVAHFDMQLAPWEPELRNTNPEDLVEEPCPDSTPFQSSATAYIQTANVEDVSTQIVRGSGGPAIPMDTFIRVHGYSYLKACMENAVSMGYDFVSVKSSPTPGDCLPSVWHQSTAPFRPGSDPRVLTVARQTPDLAPSANQLQFSHDLYLDCLPFPEFREKVIALRTVSPQVFNETELKWDIHFYNGIQCWGPTPWEKKSWEVQAWFLKKWWMITGGEHGDLGNLSRWWRLFRGQIA